MKTRMFAASNVSGAVAAVCLTLAFGPAPYARAALVSYWGMDDNAANATLANGVNAAYNATLAGSTTSAQHVAGKIGGGIAIATNHYATVGGASGLLGSLTGDYSVSLWARSTPAGAMNGELITFGGYGVPTPSVYDWTSFELYVNTLTSYQAIPSKLASTPAQTWAPDTWYHLVLTSTGGTLSMYVNGTSKAVSGGTGMHSLSSVTQSAVTIGSLIGYGLNNTPNALDDLAVWSSALSDTQVKAVGNLANVALNYNALQAEGLFFAFAETSSLTLGATTWYYHPSGIGGAAGEVIDLGAGNWSLNLGGGAGMSTIIPEPSAILLLGIGLVGMLGLGWRRRK